MTSMQEIQGELKEDGNELVGVISGYKLMERPHERGTSTFLSEELFKQILSRYYKTHSRK